MPNLVREVTGEWVAKSNTMLEKKTKHLAFLAGQLPNYPLVLNFTRDDYNGLVWGQEAYPVASKSEYIREGNALRKSLKRLKYKKQKKN